MDPIADLLSAVRVQGGFYGRIRIDASWVPPRESGSHARFGLITSGQAWLEPSGHTPIQLLSGDFFLLAPGGEFVVSPETGGALTSVVAGRFSFDGGHGRPLTDWFPPLILIRGGQPQMLPLKKTLELLVSEVDASTQGSEMAVQHLANLLLIQALRSHTETVPEQSSGLLHAFADPHIGAALNSMHKRIEHHWTVASLASEAGMSRSAFALRFKELMHESPLEYLTRWRMYRGSDLLRESDRKLADVAQAVGYDSDGAFHRAFKRVLGIGPGEYRRSVSAAKATVAG
jgi:AraC-like DNA-binding protein